MLPYHLQIHEPVDSQYLAAAPLIALLTDPAVVGIKPTGRQLFS
ncbi:hypothetical protein [uncultured Roseivirga sp.]